MVLTIEQYDKLVEYVESPNKALEILDIISDSNWTIVNDLGNGDCVGERTLLLPALYDIRNICKENNIDYLSIAYHRGVMKSENAAWFTDTMHFNTRPGCENYFSCSVRYDDYKSTLSEEDKEEYEEE